MAAYRDRRDHERPLVLGGERTGRTERDPERDRVEGAAVLDVDEVLAATVETLGHVAQVDRCFIRLFDPEVE